MPMKCKPFEDRVLDADRRPAVFQPRDPGGSMRPYWAVVRLQWRVMINMVPALSEPPTPPREESMSLLSEQGIKGDGNFEKMSPWSLTKFCLRQIRWWAVGWIQVPLRRCGVAPCPPLGSDDSPSFPGTRQVREDWVIKVVGSGEACLGSSLTPTAHQHGTRGNLLKMLTLPFLICKMMLRVPSQ